MAGKNTVCFIMKKYIRFHDKHHQQIQCKKCIDCHGKNRRLLSWKSMLMTYIDWNDKIKKWIKINDGKGGGRPINAIRSTWRQLLTMTNFWSKILFILNTSSPKIATARMAEIMTNFSAKRLFHKTKTCLEALCYYGGLFLFSYSISNLFWPTIIYI